MTHCNSFHFQCLIYLLTDALHRMTNAPKPIHLLCQCRMQFMLCKCFWYEKTERETNKNKESMVLLHLKRVMWCKELAMILMIISLCTVTSRDFHAIANQFVTQTNAASVWDTHERNYFDDIITSIRAYSNSHKKCRRLMRIFQHHDVWTLCWWLMLCEQRKLNTGDEM